MGIKTLLPSMAGAMERVHADTLKGKVAAVDVSGLIHRVLHRGSDPATFVMRCVLRLRASGIEPILVLDGPSPGAKALEVARRKATRAKSFGPDSGSRNPKHENAIKACCRKNGINFVHAPFEADPQIAYLCKEGIADFALTDDSDLIVYGVKEVYFKWNRENSDGYGDLFSLERFANAWKAPYRKDVFRAVCMAIGCDFCGGVFGFGPMSAQNLYKDLVADFSYKKMIEGVEQFGRTAPPDFEEMFSMAVGTFRHQLIINPFTDSVEPIEAYDDGFTAADFEFAGQQQGAKFEYFLPILTNRSRSFGEPPAPVVINNFPPMKTYLCKKCGDAFLTSYELKSHVREAGHGKRYSCDVCGFQTDSKNQVARHMLGHGTERPFKCDKCEKDYKSAYALATHKIQKHGTGELFHCPTCNKGFLLINKMKSHAKIHDESIKYPCSGCGKVCNRGNSRRFHYKTCELYQKLKQAKSSGTS